MRACLLLMFLGVLEHCFYFLCRQPPRVFFADRDGFLERRPLRPNVRPDDMRLSGVAAMHRRVMLRPAWDAVSCEPTTPAANVARCTSHCTFMMLHAARCRLHACCALHVHDVARCILYCMLHVACCTFIRLHAAPRLVGRLDVQNAVGVDLEHHVDDRHACCGGYAEHRNMGCLRMARRNPTGRPPPARSSRCRPPGDPIINLICARRKPAVSPLGPQFETQRLTRRTPASTPVASPFLNRRCICVASPSPGRIVDRRHSRANH